MVWLEDSAARVSVGSSETREKRRVRNMVGDARWVVDGMVFEIEEVKAW